MPVDPKDPLLLKIIELAKDAYHREEREERRETTLWYWICAVVAILFWGSLFSPPGRQVVIRVMEPAQSWAIECLSAKNQTNKTISPCILFSKP
ncbi:MAG: hypothetical protein HC847_26105 [Hydrococcus sp. RU_2_2]|nr:hypothetical protein [Hydrococcus sp. RU_2_2]NJP21957.1 hypothetical protein [Hydrococcus sp. CRU_1_1]NJQ98697.1 hypothetical protein [Hydrococcus sp. CSU_1_8]